MIRALVIVVMLANVAQADDLARAIETFSDGNCGDAIVQIAAVARRADQMEPAARGRVLLWHAAILQRCDHLDEANQVLDVLLREQPEIRVDLAELWPSFAELVDAARARNPRVVDEPARAVAPAVVATAPAAPRAFALGVALIPAAGRETTVDDEQFKKLGSGLAASAAFDRGVWRAELATHAIRYAAPEGAMTGGWEVGGALRLGTGLHLGDRFTVSAHALVAANLERGGDRGVDRVGLGLGGAMQWRPTAKLRVTAGVDWIPVAVVAVDGMDAADPNLSVLIGTGLAWAWSSRWACELAVELDQHAMDVHRGGASLHQADMIMRLSLGVKHRY